MWACTVKTVAVSAMMAIKMAVKRGRNKCGEVERLKISLAAIQAAADGEIRIGLKLE